MHESAILTLAVLVLGFGLLSRRLGHGVVTPPLAFVAFGLFLSPAFLKFFGLTGPFAEIGHLEGAIHLLGEITLVIVLFTDASQIDLRALRSGAALPLRLLGLGMPLTIALGAAAAAFLFPGLSLWEAALLGAVLAPTDAALGQAVVTSKEVPLGVRQGLSAESGLNDGIAVPLVVIFASLAGAGQEIAGELRTTVDCLLFALRQVTFGPAVGLLVGGVAVWLMERAIRSKSMDHAYQELAGLATALIAYTAAGEIGGNGFIAAFVAGLIMGNSSKIVCERLYDFAEAESQLLMLVTFFLLGLGPAWGVLSEAPLSAWIYAAASLTVLRMVPVAIALWGSGMGKADALFVGWFGPRGLASVLFAILLAEKLHVPHSEEIAQVVLVTVLLSVLAHGVTAAPGSRLYARTLRDSSAMDAAGPTPVRKKMLDS